MSTSGNGTVAAIGATHQLEGFALVGARIHRAATTEETLAVWRGLADDVVLAILSREAAAALEPVLSERRNILTVTMP